MPSRAAFVTVAGLSLVLAALAAEAAPQQPDPLGDLVRDRGWTGSSATPPPRRSAPPARAPAADEPDLPEAAPGADDASSAAGLVADVKGRAAGLLQSAVGLLGVPYRRGGESADTGFDCSGFTRHVFDSIGLALPRRSSDQARAPGMKKVVRRSDLRPGDLVFFNTLRSTFSHVGIYLGDHKFIHAPRSGGLVRVEDIRVGYWTQRFNGGRRAAEFAAEASAPADERAGRSPGAAGVTLAPRQD